MTPSYPKLIISILMIVYFLSIAYDPMAGCFLDIVDLPIHETGHLLFRPFGEFMTIAGGSLFQVIMPAIFVGYFVHQHSYYSAAVAMLWVGQSLINVYIYAADAVVMQLVLTSGFTGSEGSFHDWNYMLTRLGLIDSTKTVAGIIRMLGTFTIIAAGALSVYFSLWADETELDNFE